MFLYLKQRRKSLKTAWIFRTLLNFCYCRKLLSFPSILTFHSLSFCRGNHHLVAVFIFSEHFRLSMTTKRKEKPAHLVCHSQRKEWCCLGGIFWCQEFWRTPSPPGLHLFCHTLQKSVWNADKSVVMLWHILLGHKLWFSWPAERRRDLPSKIMAWGNSTRIARRERQLCYHCLYKRAETKSCQSSPGTAVFSDTGDPS